MADSTAFEIEIEKALLYFNRGEYTQAREAAISARAYQLNNSLALFIIAVSAIRLGENELARSAVEDLLAACPEVPDAHLANALYQQEIKRDLIGAEHSYRTVIQLGPDSPNGYAELGLFLSRRKRIEEGITVTWKGLKLDPENKHTLAALQQLYRLNNDQKMAEKMGTRLLELSPDSDGAHLERGLLLLEQGETDQARGNFLESLRLQPTDGESMEVIAHEKVRTHPLFKNALMLSLKPLILGAAIATPLFWWLLSLVLSPFIILFWISLVVVILGYGHHGLFYLCRAITLRRLRNGRL